MKYTIKGGNTPPNFGLPCGKTSLLVINLHIWFCNTRHSYRMTAESSGQSIFSFILVFLHITVYGLVSV